MDCQVKVNATAASLLGFLHEGPMSGWDLVATAQVLIGDFWTLTRSQVYRELAAMEKAGLVVAGPPGPRDRRPYELTDAGRAAFVAWLAQPPAPEQIRYPLLLTIAFGRHLPPAQMAEFVAEHRAVHEERLGRYRSLRDDAGDNLGPYATATLDFGIRYETAVLEWFADLPPAIAGPKDQGTAGGGPGVGEGPGVGGGPAGGGTAGSRARRAR